MVSRSSHVTNCITISADKSQTTGVYPYVSWGKEGREDWIMPVY